MVARASAIIWVGIPKASAQPKAVMTFSTLKRPTSGYSTAMRVPRTSSTALVRAAS